MQQEKLIVFYTNSHSRVFINLKITFIIPNLDQFRRMHSLLSKHNRVVENREFELNERLKESENGVHKTILDLRELELYRVEEKSPSFYLESLRNVSQSRAESRLGLGISTSFYSSRMRSDDARKISSRPIKLIIETSNTPTYRIVSRRFRAKIRFHEKNLCFARKPIYLNAVIIKTRDLKKKKNFIATFMNSSIIFFFGIYIYIYSFLFNF